MDKVSRAHHLTLNEEKNNGTGSDWCTYCTRRTFNVTTNKDQLVNLRISTWDGRGMSQTCKGQFDPNSPVGLGGRYHIGYYAGGHFGSRYKQTTAFKMGDLDFGQVEMKAG